MEQVGFDNGQFRFFADQGVELIGDVGEQRADFAGPLQFLGISAELLG
ncbi:MAG: hypothetical protein R3C12_00345 [Planctomycetaceae bacterium]